MAGFKWQIKAVEPQVPKTAQKPGLWEKAPLNSTFPFPPQMYSESTVAAGQSYQEDLSPPAVTDPVMYLSVAPTSLSLLQEGSQPDVLLTFQLTAGTGPPIKDQPSEISTNSRAKK